MNLQEALNEIRSVLGHRICILFHHNADPDALCSAYALSRLLPSIRAGVEVAISPSKGLSKISKRVAEHLGMTLEENPLIEEMDTLFVVDTGSLQQLEEMKDRVLAAKAPLVVIDHHAEHAETKAASRLYIVDEEAASTCEIVYGLYKEAGVKPTGQAAKALLLGIAYDTRRFALGTSATFKAIGELLELDGALAEVPSLLTRVMDRSEKIARLKAGQRMKIYMIDGWLVISAEVSSYQASAARGLLSLGADLTLVGGSGEEGIRISMRSTDSFYSETSLHLGRDIALPLGEAFKGAGSGHSTAAGVNALGGLEEALNMAVKMVSERLTHI
jgi:nanoRNase/pAp phosphatase (c-di-AMP/oligoRNAs hydrolase)